MLSYNNQEPGHWNADWDVRMEWTIKLFKEGLFDRCIADCRTMLLYRRLPHEYKICCHALIAASLRDQNEAEDERVVAEELWDIQYAVHGLTSCYFKEHYLAARGILDDLAEHMEKDLSAKAGSRHRKKEVSRKKKKVSCSSVRASASDTPTSHAIPAAQGTVETILPSRPAITLTFRSRGPAEGDSAAAQNDRALGNRISQDILSASASHKHDHGRADGTPIPVDCIHSQDRALDDADGDDVVMSEE